MAPIDLDRTSALGGQDAITARNAAESPLLRRAAEIRNQIWTDVLGEHCVSISLGPSYEHPDFLTCAVRSRSHQSLSRLSGNTSPRVTSGFVGSLASRVCRQMRAEIAGLRFKNTRFRFTSSGALEKFCEQYSLTQRLAIQEISLGPVYGVTKRWPLYGSSGAMPTYRPCVSFKQLLPKLKTIYLNPAVFSMRNGGTIDHVLWPVLDNMMLNNMLDELMEELLGRLAVTKGDCEGVEFVLCDIKNVGVGDSLSQGQFLTYNF
ncbi:hypothetical protein BU23DRAFT_255108 [Bimuria novae-zelandiae CBS 107.79]|uniref:Uncharacterized protein n=1 Tax=Bimuria novae-zelandiae CBS 107.79 TaxID=1447943 RepID=A0A6A5V1D9_9PLEO|nr:hypothetical protein BU23DRAFT_255108 [Bimuria novae-zelandiae CBS 107.79]